jgi:hypothetical protein
MMEKYCHVCETVQEFYEVGLYDSDRNFWAEPEYFCSQCRLVT